MNTLSPWQEAWEKFGQYLDKQLSLDLTWNDVYTALFKLIPIEEPTPEEVIVHERVIGYLRWLDAQIKYLGIKSKADIRNLPQKYINLEKTLCKEAYHVTPEGGIAWLS